jgi:hypothetical protein
MCVIKILRAPKAAEAYIADHRGSWQNADHGRQWLNSLRDYVYPIIGQLNVTDIDMTQVLKVLEQPKAGGKFWLTRPTTADRVRNRIELILNRAMARADQKHDNPAAWDKLQHILAAPTKRVIHHAALPPRVLTKVENAVKVEPVGEFALKGIRRPLAAYNVVGATSHR